MTDATSLEDIAIELMEAYTVTTPPVPVENMLQNPREGMWQELDINKLSGTFLTLKDVHSPRMSLSRLLARHIIYSDWGQERKLEDLVKQIAEDDGIYAFARMLIMPRSLIEAMSSSSRTPVGVSMQFEVPEEDARVRLQELSS